MSQEMRKPPVIGRAPSPLTQPTRIPAPPRIPPAARVPPPLTRVSKRPEPVARKRSLLTPAELERFKNLLVFARSTVEGFFVGKHKSPHHGSSVEFTDYKEYVPGDDVARIDWRAFGRSRRLYVRQYEAETDMTVYLLVDVSASMDYAGSGQQSKYVLAAKVAAALAYLMIHQGDKTALALFADTLRHFLPAGGTRRHLHQLVSELEEVEPASTTGIGRALHECSSLFRKRGRLVVLSDFWDDQAGTLDALSQFLHRKFEILLLHIVHPHELDLPGLNAARFEDMESHEEVEVEPEEIRAAYRETARKRIDALAREANNRRISHALVNTERPYLDALEAYLGFRGGHTASSRTARIS
jgi:uncharacterized protein (DUF58 family)